MHRVLVDTSVGIGTIGSIERAAKGLAEKVRPTIHESQWMEIKIPIVNHLPQGKAIGEEYFVYVIEAHIVTYTQ